MNFVHAALSSGNGKTEKLLAPALRGLLRQGLCATKVPSKNRIWRAWTGIGIGSTEESLRNLGQERIERRAPIQTDVGDEAAPLAETALCFGVSHPAVSSQSQACAVRGAWGRIVKHLKKGPYRHLAILKRNEWKRNIYN
jgi:hypothetical protein